MRLRTLLAALSLAAVPVAPAPAHAGAGRFTGTVTIGCFGCGTYGPSGNHGSFTLTGVTNGEFTAEFTITTPPGSGCVLTDSVAGDFSGAVTGSFTWTRYGQHLDIRTNGLPGEGTFVITEPIGNPCGMAVTAFVSGTLVF